VVGRSESGDMLTPSGPSTAGVNKKKWLWETLVGVEACSKVYNRGQREGVDWSIMRYNKRIGP